MLGLGIFFWFNSSLKTKLESPFSQTLGKVLGFENNSPNNKPDLLDQTRDSFTKTAQGAVNTVKTTVYNEAKTTLDNVFNKPTSNDQPVNVSVLRVSSTDNINPSYTIDLSKDTNLNLSLSVNRKYYLKFQNIPINYCLYINNNKYPLDSGVVEILLTQVGNFPIKTNSCNINDKNIGILSVH